MVHNRSWKLNPHLHKGFLSIGMFQIQLKREDMHVVHLCLSHYAVGNAALIVLCIVEFFLLPCRNIQTSESLSAESTMALESLSNVL